MKTIIEWQDQFGYWRRYGMSHHTPSAFKSATARAHSTGKRHRLVDEDGVILDLINP